MKITDGMIKKTCSSMIFKRGTEYFKEGRVHLRKRSESEILAVVDGGERYNVRITFDDDKIKDVFCTCPYYETMQTPCKHIVATLKQRQLELEQGGSYTDENDRIASSLCREFSLSGDKRIIRASFTLYINQTHKGCTFAMSVSLPDFGGGIGGLENFLDSYLNYTDYKLDRSTVYNRYSMEFPQAEDDVIGLLAEVYETRSTDMPLYTKASHRTEFGAAAARRLLPMLEKLDFKLVLDGIAVNGVRITEDDPDILIDIEAYDREIMLSVSERGTAITPDGEWFFHNDTIYRTTPGWRKYYMPIYRALSGQSRTQISFKGENAVKFAAVVLPELRNHRGVVASGVDELIVNEKPEFEVCLDADRIKGITAVIIASYGGIRFRIPSESSDSNDRIVVRSFGEEERILAFFSSFTYSDGIFSIASEEGIYEFLRYDLQELAKYAQIKTTDSFNNMKIADGVEIAASVSYKNDIDFLEIDFETDLSDEEMRGILSALRLGRDFYRLAGGAFVPLDGSADIDVLRLIERLDVTNEDIENGRKILPKYNILYLDAASFIDKDKSVREYIDSMRRIEPDIPEELSGVLRPYQEEGVRWFAQLNAMGMGGILADDMGLGKTLQVIAYVHGAKSDKPALIVAPSTLTYNWQREIEKFTPDARSVIISGSKEVRSELIKKAGEYEFVITSYPLLRRDIAQYRNIEFSYCFIDEAQYIKNPKTMNAVSVKKINARRRFALTGTPIENSLMELWSIFDFIMPGYLKSSRDFKNRFGAPLEKQRGADRESDTLRALIKPFILRRMKRDVLNELPEKIETTMFADLTKEQKVIYTEYLSVVRGKAQGILRSRGSRFMILTLLLRLRQICCHPKLFDPECECDSGKLDLLNELVSNAVDGGHRVLIFSQFRSMLDIIAKMLEKEELSYFYINGTTPMSDRTDMAERFNSGEREVFLVSLKAGGTGLNLVGADTVIHYDPWWNPAVTDQATDRAYRIGQTRAVNVIKLAARGTIEEKILRLQDNKRMLAEDIIRVNTETLSGFTDEEIMSLFDA